MLPTGRPLLKLGSEGEAGGVEGERRSEGGAVLFHRLGDDFSDTLGGEGGLRAMGGRTEDDEEADATPGGRGGTGGGDSERVVTARLMLISSGSEVSDKLRLCPCFLTLLELGRRFFTDSRECAPSESLALALAFSLDFAVTKGFEVDLPTEAAHPTTVWDAFDLDWGCRERGRRGALSDARLFSTVWLCFGVSSKSGSRLGCFEWLMIRETTPLLFPVPLFFSDGSSSSSMRTSSTVVDRLLPKRDLLLSR